MKNPENSNFLKFPNHKAIYLTFSVWVDFVIADWTVFIYAFWAATAALLHPLTVFLINIAIVIGPTPPGTWERERERESDCEWEVVCTRQSDRERVRGCGLEG